MTFKNIKDWAAPIIVIGTILTGVVFYGIIAGIFILAGVWGQNVLYFAQSAGALASVGAFVSIAYLLLRGN